MLKRATPMKRTGFASKGWPPMDRERAIRAMPSVDPSRFRLPQPVSGEVAPQPKATYVRSKALREAYRLIPCQSCVANDGTVVCAHANESWAGKGMGIKASDDMAASLCFTCHSRLDQGSDMTREERRAFWLAAHLKTIPALVAAGHWPKDIPVPEWLECVAQQQQTDLVSVARKQQKVLPERRPARGRGAAEIDSFSPPMNCCLKDTDEQ